MKPYIEVLVCKECGKFADAIKKDWHPLCSKCGDTIERKKICLPLLEEIN